MRFVVIIFQVISRIRREFQCSRPADAPIRNEHGPSRAKFRSYQGQRGIFHDGSHKRIKPFVPDFKREKRRGQPLLFYLKQFVKHRKRPTASGNHHNISGNASPALYSDFELFASRNRLYPMRAHHLHTLFPAYLGQSAHHLHRILTLREHAPICLTHSLYPLRFPPLERPLRRKYSERRSNQPLPSGISLL